MIMAANRVGKTRSAAAEVAYHLTGKYPAWWEGRRFAHGVLAWCGGVTNEATRDVVQAELLGEHEFGTGMVLGDLIHGKPTYRQAGVSNVVDAFRVQHVSGQVSLCVLKTYEQGWRKWQGKSVHVVWLDEEPDDFKIYTEALTRTLTARGILMTTFTPLLGATDLVNHFVDTEARGIWMITATWDDAPHLDGAAKEQLLASYPAHERDTRTKGIPVMGSGRVFAGVDEETLKVPPFPIPAHFARICGIDFGVDHPAAGVWLAWDRDADVVYVTDCYKESNQTAVYHAAAIKSRGEWIPVAWPHDGLERDKGSGIPLRDQFLKHSVNMLVEHAQYSDDRGNAVEPALMDMLERMKTGRFKVFAHLNTWFEEFRQYHRKDGRIVKLRDDVMAATRYGHMMLRYAAPYVVPGAHRVAAGRKLRNW